jgi:hypothetical protein
VLDSFDKLISDCGLVDSYIHSNPAGRSVCSERFTCWDQYRNERYENKGARIDYVFVDQSVLKSVRLCEDDECFADGRIRQTDSSQNSHKTPLTAMSVSSDRTYALKSATANHLWKPVPFHGGGVDGDTPICSARDFEFTFTNPPQTGIVYTAPIFSDHVGTSCVLDLACLDSKGIDDRLGDDLGSRWSARMAEAIVAPSHKSHSLKDMFMKVAIRKEQMVAAANEAQSAIGIQTSQTDVINLEDDSCENVSSKRRKI